MTSNSWFDFIKAVQTNRTASIRYPIIKESGTSRTLEVAVNDVVIACYTFPAQQSAAVWQRIHEVRGWRS